METTRHSLVTVQRDEPPTVAVDYDLTLIDEDEEVLPGAKAALAHLQQNGWRVIIWTGNHDLKRVRQVLQRHGVPFDYINENPESDAHQKVRKIHFHATVDDRAIQFRGNWPEVVAELEHRRTQWGAGGFPDHPGIRLMGLDAEGKPRAFASFALDGERVVVRTGAETQIVRAILEDGIAGAGSGMMLRPRDGVAFLRALADVQGTYFWSEMA